MVELEAGLKAGTKTTKKPEGNVPSGYHPTTFHP